jgi:hypothetical protein
MALLNRGIPDYALVLKDIVPLWDTPSDMVQGYIDYLFFKSLWLIAYSHEQYY